MARTSSAKRGTVTATRAASKAPGTNRAAGGLRVERFGCNGLDELDPHALAVTYCFDAADHGDPYPVTVRFDGRRVDAGRATGPRDRFSVTETVERVVPGSGRVCVTRRVAGINRGEWRVTAAVVDDRRRGRGPKARPAPRPADAAGATGYAPVMRILAPGARLGAWPALVGIGVVVALVTQNRLAERRGLESGRVLVLSLLACVVGLVGAKLYYLLEHRGRQRGLATAGLCIQGFVIGAIATVVAGAAATGLGVGAVLDVTTPGLLFGMTIGRFGCFCGGCCAGRPTASRFGLWSSDRRLGVRRIPTQLLEAAVAAACGVAAFVIVWRGEPDPGGLVFVGALAAYTFGRQVLFPFRDLPRHTKAGRPATMVLAGAAVVAAVAFGLAA